MVEQDQGEGDASVWIREGERRLEGRDDNRRLEAVRAGLGEHPGVRPVGATASDERLDRTLAALHDAPYLEALAAAGAGAPEVLPSLAPPGLDPDIPVTAELVAAAREGVRTAITAAERVGAGARFAYAVCRPPGHHAGPGFLGGYCYLNNAAAAVRTLLDTGLGPVGVLDLDLHYPNGTAALVAAMGEEATLHSLHAWPVTNVAPATVLPQAPRERVVAYAASPGEEAYLAAVRASVAELTAGAGALVVSLGYDTVAGDPHGGWDFRPLLFAEVGCLLAAAGPPVCVVQEGGYSLPVLAECAHAFVTGLLSGEGG
jgi:acetoin utilization deacetylase AcuC-like enzyme